ncbi:MAG: phosphoenolpyruvate carboxylase, partial [Verrucomicrobiae bacterium]|nr:phosphoenolpyruvate carboxylase [Verrucomicrobiae bacterium]NNJ87051.1 phosphoenolpyruvate carboxylase [Akkermansiaceae bacterium]
MAQLQAICFEVLNLVEERIALLVRNRRRSDFGLAAERGMWGRVIFRLHEAGFTEQEVIDGLREIKVTPVLTAHPTEAKRPTVRERHLALYKDLVRWDRNLNDPVALSSVMESIKVGLETLWHTGEIHASRPSIIGELRHTIYYLREVFPKTVNKLDVSLEQAWAEVGWDVGLLREANAYPQLKFGTWVGGDRDGHPLVTADITATALRKLRKHALRIHAKSIRDAADVLTMSPSPDEVPQELTQRVLELRKQQGSQGREICSIHAREPWRCMCYLMRDKLSDLNSHVYIRAEDYLADLNLMEKTLESIGAQNTARSVIHPLRRLVEVFGFHLATLDIRQNSPFHDKAAAQMLGIVGVPDAENYPSWTEQEKVDFLTNELKNERPWRPWEYDPESEIGKVMDCFKVVRRHARIYGDDCFGLYVVSMTRNVSDLLLVHLLAREGRLAEWKDGMWVSRIPACPLFETGDDLDRGGDIVESYFSHAPGGQFLAKKDGPATVSIMVGYSDSNKDSGMLSGQWSLQKAQANITTACARIGARCEFFHGRGGTISRGAGPIKWFLRSLPDGSLDGAMRITEQGEVIPRKYSHRSGAAYNLELLLAGVTGVTMFNRKAASDSSVGTQDYAEVMGWLSRQSRLAYRELIEAPGFMEFYRQATPIDALEHGCFGSRPARRTGSATLDDLRAIPWVFSWTQARFYLPGWYGVGSALKKLKEDDLDGFQALSNMVENEPFLRYLLTNVETNLASADIELMGSYASLVDDEEIRQRFHTRIVEEFELTEQMIDEVFGSTFSERRPRMLRTLKMRESSLQLLHQQQVGLLAEWRQALKNDDDSKLDDILNALQYTVNAIASGLRTTG